MKVKSLEYIRLYAKLATTKRVFELGKKLAAERIVDQDSIKEPHIKKLTSILKTRAQSFL